MNDYKINQQKKTPIKRNSFFYDMEQLSFETQLAKEYIENDMGMTVILYRVDVNKTNIDDTYGETRKDSINFLPPIEVPCVYELEDAELRAYDKTKNLGTYQKMGKLKMGVMVATLKELDIDIKVGDYIGVQTDVAHMEYFTVENDGKNNYANVNTLWGRGPLVRNIVCAPVEKSVFNG
jgi:hypothetical protein